MINKVFNTLKWLIAACGISVSSIGVYEYTRDRDIIRSEPETTIVNQQGYAVHIGSAEIYGKDSVLFSIDTIVKTWKSKPRRCPTSLMLAKARCETNFKSCEMRYEKGRHLSEESWKKFSEFDATSGGMFQIMGFNLKKYNITHWGLFCQNLELQLDIFDDFMSDCIYRAQLINNGKPLIYKAISAYGGNPSTINILSDINYNWYLFYAKNYS